MNNDDISAISSWLDSGSINIFGRPFSGKDTQGRKLVELFGGSLLGGGNILRGPKTPDHITAGMRTGKLIPTKDYIDIVLPYLSKPELAGQPLILSSVGRWIGEEQEVLKATEQAGHKLKAVIYLNISEDTVRKRWHALHNINDRGDRHDDTLEILEVRLAEYREKTLPVLEVYRQLGILVDINGEQSVDQVASNIIKSLANLASASH